MAVTSKTTYTTSDGKSYDTEVEAQAHEAVLSMHPAVLAYAAETVPEFLANGRKNPQRERVANVIINWLEHQAAKGV